MYIFRYIDIYTYKGSLSPVDLVVSGPLRPSKPRQAFILLTTKLALYDWAFHTFSPQRPL